MVIADVFRHIGDNIPLIPSQMTKIPHTLYIGGKIELGGKRPSLLPPFDKGAFFEPTVITGIYTTSLLYLRIYISSHSPL